MNYLIAGLGNIGTEYENTRHNMGFMVLDAFLKASDTFFITERYGSVAEYSFKGNKIILLKPSTYMNLSGNAVRYWLQKKKIQEENLLVVCDDLALPFGTLRMRKKGSDGGHNGLKNINETLGNSNYARLRMGIGDEFSRGGQIDYVLGKFTKQDEELLNDVILRAVEAIKLYIAIGPDKAMNICNVTVKSSSVSGKQEHSKD
jgi:peptidyl-tRNA hydrolase, PTH1 family